MRRANGFTLVEMLIALSIFGMLTAAGVTLLSLTARTQETSDRLLAELGEIRRTGALLTADLAQATPRLYRDRDGRPQRAFTGGRGDEPGLMAFRPARLGRRRRRRRCSGSATGCAKGGSSGWALPGSTAAARRSR